MATLGTTVISTVTLVTDTLQDNQAEVTSWSLARMDGHSGDMYYYL